MSSQPLQHQVAQRPLGEDLDHVPQTFADAIAHIQTIVLEAFDREIAAKQLCYHTREHIEGVQRRAKQLFQAVRPYLQSAVDSTRMEQLLALCAVAHDLIQIFVPPTEPHATRRREAGISETATIESLFALISTVNQPCPDRSAHFTEHDRQIIREAIAATICDYDPIEQAIFQPALYDHEPPIALVARMLALADIGTLGMEGIEAYNREGSLLFLEENPDVRSLLECHKLDLASDNPDLCENIRQRLLKRAQFQVNFARSRCKRCPQELEGFPVEAIPALTREFQYLSPATMQAIELTTPTAKATSLDVLITFFQFEQVTNQSAP